MQCQGNACNESQPRNAHEFHGDKNIGSYARENCPEPIKSIMTNYLAAIAQSDFNKKKRDLSLKRLIRRLWSIHIFVSFGNSNGLIKRYGRMPFLAFGYCAAYQFASINTCNGYRIRIDRHFDYFFHSLEHSRLFKKEEPSGKTTRKTERISKEEEETITGKRKTPMKE